MVIAVPEAEGYSLMLAGFAAVGFAVRRKRSPGAVQAQVRSLRHAPIVSFPRSAAAR
jgi:PEP-CTERM motif